MHSRSRSFLNFAAALAFAAFSLAPAATLAQSNAAKTDQWIHVRVESKDVKGDTVRVNVPIDLAEKVLPAINKEKLHNGKVHIDSSNFEDVDLRAILDAVRSSHDGEYVTVQSRDNDVRVAKNAGYLYIHVTDKSKARKSVDKDASGKDTVSPATLRESNVEIKVPMKVVDALLSAGKDELDIVAALHALSANGDTELVSVKSDENTVRVWIDSKNIAD
jgi:hypothetical protein